MKIDLKYLKKNLDLNKFINSLDKVVSSIDGDDIVYKLLESYKSFIDKNGDEIEIYEEAKKVRNKKQESLFSDLFKLSQQGKLLPMISKNFALIKKMHLDLTSLDFFLYCIHSKVNNTYYMKVCRHDYYNDGASIMFKSKSKQQVFKVMDESYEFAHNKQVYPGDPEYKKILV